MAMSESEYDDEQYDIDIYPYDYPCCHRQTQSHTSPTYQDLYGHNDPYNCYSCNYCQIGFPLNELRIIECETCKTLLQNNSFNQFIVIICHKCSSKLTESKLVCVGTVSSKYCDAMNEQKYKYKQMIAYHPWLKTRISKTRRYRHHLWFEILPIFPNSKFYGVEIDTECVAYWAGEPLSVYIHEIDNKYYKIFEYVPIKPYNHRSCSICQSEFPLKELQIIKCQTCKTLLQCKFLKQFIHFTGKICNNCSSKHKLVEFRLLCINDMPSIYCQAMISYHPWSKIKIIKTTENYLCFQISPFFTTTKYYGYEIDKECVEQYQLYEDEQSEIEWFIRKINDKFYKIFIYHKNIDEFTKCAHKYCENMELDDMFCQNHRYCSMCNKYFLSSYHPKQYKQRYFLQQCISCRYMRCRDCSRTSNSYGLCLICECSKIIGDTSCNAYITQQMDIFYDSTMNVVEEFISSKDVIRIIINHCYGHGEYLRNLSKLLQIIR